MREDDLPYRVEVWDDKDNHIEELIALASDYATARSAFEDAVKRSYITQELLPSGMYLGASSDILG